MLAVAIITEKPRQRPVSLACTRTALYSTPCEGNCTKMCMLCRTYTVQWSVALRVPMVPLTVQHAYFAVSFMGRRHFREKNPHLGYGSFKEVACLLPADSTLRLKPSYSGGSCAVSHKLQYVTKPLGWIEKLLEPSISAAFPFYMGQGIPAPSR